MTRTVTLAAMILALAPSSALAARHDRMTFGYARTVAVDYWAKRGVIVPCDPKPVFLTYADTEGWDITQRMFAGEQDCTIAITPWADLRDDPSDAWMFCQEIVHEVGHLAGLEHSDDENSIMAASPLVVPWGCDHQRQFLRAHGRIRRLSRALRGTWALRTIARSNRLSRCRARTDRCERT